MKVVWLGIDYKNTSLDVFRHYYNAFVEIMASKTDVSYYGTGVWKKEDDVQKIVEMENPDIVLLWGRQSEGPNNRGWINLDKIKVPKLLRCADEWANYRKHMEFIHKNNINVCFVEHYESVEYYKEHITNGCEVIPFHWAADTRYFKDLKLERIYDVSMTGSFGSTCHPLRKKMFEELPKHPDIKSFISGGFPIPFSEYPTFLNQSKIMAFDSVNEAIDGVMKKWTNERYHDAMACKALCLSDKSEMCEKLHLIPNYNFVEVNENNFLEKIRYYLQNKEERDRIISNAYQTVMQYNTVEVRVRQAIEIMEKLIKKP